MAVNFPAGDPNIPDAALVGESLETMHAGAGHPATTNRMRDNIKALAAKLGYGASLPTGVGVLRRLASGTSAWGQTKAGDYEAASVGLADLALLPNGRVLLGRSGANTAAQIKDADVDPAALIGLAKLALLPNGTVLLGRGGANTAAAITNADIANQTIRGGADGAGGKISPGSIANADIQDGSINGGTKLLAQTVTGAAVGPGMIIAYRTIYGGQAGPNSNIAPGSIIGSDLLNGTLATPQIATGGQIVKRQLSYIAATDLWSGGGFTSGSGWVDFCAYQSFPIDDANALTMVAVRSSTYLANYSGQIMTRIVIDGSFVAPLGGIAGATGANAQANPFSGAGPVFVSGLASGSHQVKVQIITNGTITNMYCRCSGQPNIESFAIEVVEFKR